MAYTYDDYTIGWIAALEVELAAAMAILNEPLHSPLKKRIGDSNTYTLGQIGDHNVIVAGLPAGSIGNNPATQATMHLLRTFPKVKLILMVGIGGGVSSADVTPEKDVRLGDIVVSTPDGIHGGVVQYDFGTVKQISDSLQPQFIRKGTSTKPPTTVRTALTTLRARARMKGYQFEEFYNDILKKYPRMKEQYQRPEHDRLFQEDYVHAGGDCSTCLGSKLVERRLRNTQDIVVHYGTIGSANQVLRDAILRDRLYLSDGIICFEMEAAGMMDVGCLVIRGICDYCDSHKNKDWQPFASAMAAAYAKEVLLTLPAEEIEELPLAAEVLEAVQNQTNEIQKQQDMIKNLDKDSKHVHLLNWLRAPDVRSVQSRLQEQKEPGTCEWLQESPIYQSWQYRKLQNLWITGTSEIRSIDYHFHANVVKLAVENPSSCMANHPCTMLSYHHRSHVIDVLGKTYKSAEDVALGFFYFDTNDPTRQAPDSLLRSLVSQLWSHLGYMPTVLDSAFKQSDSGRYQPSESMLLECFENIIMNITKVYLVVDGVDECSDLPRLSKLFRNFRNLEPYKVSTLVASRSGRDIEDHLKQCFQCSIDVQETRSEDDLAKYIDSNLKQESGLGTWPESIKMEIRSTLTANANGMFLWVFYQLAELKTCLSPKQIHRTLKSIPNKNMTDIYDTVMANLRARHGVAVEVVLNWLVCCARPLSIDEAAEIAAIDLLTDVVVDEEARLRDPQDILRICGNFALVSETQEKSSYSGPSRTLTIAHASIKSYLLNTTLESDSGDTSIHVHLTLAESCLAYVLQAAFQNLKVYQQLERFPLLQYAASYWVFHARKVQHASGVNLDKLDRLVLSLLTKPNALLFWNQIYDVTKAYPSERFHLHANDLEVPWVYAAMAGLDRFVDLLWKDQAHHELLENTSQIARSLVLDVAIENGFTEIIQRLIGMKDILGPNIAAFAFNTAAYAGNLEIVSTLLESNVSIDSLGTNRERGTALQAAASRGNLEVVKLLIERGADVNASSGEHGSALAAAAYSGHVQTVAFLLEKGAEINRAKEVPRKYFCSMDFEPVNTSLNAGRLVIKIDDPLFTVAYQNCQPWQHRSKPFAEIATLLLGSMTLDQKDSEYMSDILFISSLGGNLEIVSLVLNQPSLQPVMTLSLQKALAAAIRENHQPILELLFARGASLLFHDPANERNYTWTYLRAVAVSGSPKLANMVLQTVTQENHRMVSWALALALESGGGLPLLEAFINQGIAFATRRDEQILLSACYRAQSHILSYILDTTGIDVNGAFKYHVNLLSKVARDGSAASMKVLLKYGAHVNATGGRYGCPLHAAICAMDIEKVDVLLQAGADPNLLQEEGPALVCALQRHLWEEEIFFPSGSTQDFIKSCIELLLAHSADVNLKGPNGMPPLCIAIARGLNATIDILLSKDADPSVVDPFGRDALFWAIIRKNDPLTKRFLDLASVHWQYSEAARAVTQLNSQLDMVQLLNKGLDPNSLDFSGRTLSFHAHWLKRSEIQQLLESKNYEPMYSEMRSPSIPNAMVFSSRLSIEIEASKGRFRVKLSGNEFENTVCLRSNLSIAQLHGISYTELEVISDGYTVIGICDDLQFPNLTVAEAGGIFLTSRGMVGCRTIHKLHFLHHFLPNWGTKATVGCGRNYDKNSAFFVVNGAFVEFQCEESDPAEYFGISTNCKNAEFVINFGAHCFEFDLGAYKEGKIQEFELRESDRRALDGPRTPDVSSHGLELLFDIIAHLP